MAKLEAPKAEKVKFEDLVGVMEAINRGADREMADTLCGEIYELVSQTHRSTIMLSLAMVFTGLIIDKNTKEQNLVLGAFPLLVRCVLDSAAMDIDAKDGNHRHAGA